MHNHYDGYKIAANGDVTISATEEEGYGTESVIPFAEFQRIAEQSADAERGNTDLPILEGMI